MKKLVIIVVLGLIGGGVYLYMNPKALAKVQNEVNNLIAGTDWRDLKKYRQQFDKASLEEQEETEGYVSDFKDKMTQINFTDSDGGEVILAHTDDEPQAIILKFGSSGDVATYAKSVWKDFFGKEASFSGEGKESSEFADGYFKTVDGKSVVEIFRKDLERLVPVAELPEEVKNAITSLKEIISEKVKMEKVWGELNDEKHHCFDQVRFKAITEQMEKMEATVAEMTATYKKAKTLIPHAQLVLIQEELDKGSIK
jgi:hypothetical protein